MQRTLIVFCFWFVRKIESFGIFKFFLNKSLTNQKRWVIINMNYGNACEALQVLLYHIAQNEGGI